MANGLISTIPHKLPRRLFLCATALAGLAAVAALLHRALPWRVPEVTQKLNHFKAHKDDFDTIFIGSSRIYHGISPRTFDAAMSAAGTPTRSFNLAVNALLPPESILMARSLITSPPPHLRRVFLEMADARDLPGADHPTVRDVYWQDPAALGYALRRARLDLADGFAKSWSGLSREAQLFAFNEFNIGWLTPMPAFEPLPGRRESVLGPDGDGFLPILHPLLQASRAKLAQGIGLLRRRGIDRPFDPLNEHEYAGLQRTLEGHGIELILVMTPVSDRDYNAQEDAPSRARLIAFDDPDRYPEFYDPAHRFDSDHLNAEGAQIFSRELAHAYLARK